MPDSASAVAVVQRQTDAWNAKDGAAFAACYTPEAEVVFYVGDEVVSIRGREAIEAAYQSRFDADPELRVVIEHRHCHDGIVTDLEYIPLRKLRATVVFHVNDGLIDRAWVHSARRLSPSISAGASHAD